MKLNKKECRKFAVPKLKMNPENGILHALQTDYVVRTAVKTIDHHKTLILYIYPREHAARGDARPCMTLFHGRDDFITLAMDGDRSTKWRTASFDNLGEKLHFTNECAFYSAEDAERVGSYFKNSTENGFGHIVKEQFKIQEKRRMERRRMKERLTASRMSCVRPLPRGLKHWIHRSVMPAYFFYDYSRWGKDVPGICSSCGRETVLSGVKQGARKTCPHCRKELICRPRSRRGRNMHDRDTVQVIQGTSDGGLVVRIIKVYYSYEGDMPEAAVYENARQFICRDDGGAVHTESYYYGTYGGMPANWRKGTRPVFNYWQYNFEADTCGHLFTRNLPDALAGTPWQYCPIDRFYGHFHEPMQSIPFLSAYLAHPRLEHLVKAGFYSIVSDLAYRCSTACLDESRNRTHQILHIAAEDVQFLRGIDPGLETVGTYQRYTGLKGRRELLLWQLGHKVKNNIVPVLQHMTPHKAMRYLDAQFSSLKLRKTPGGGIRYENMQALVTEYRDYLEMCARLDYDMKNSFVLFPKDLQKAHDKAAEHQKQRADEKLRRDFSDAYSKIKGQFDFEHNGLKIVYPDSPDIVIAEGHELHHCVGGYARRAADQECIILFLRQCSELSRPFYTIEIRDWKIIQVRGLKNCSATPEVQAFIAAWEKRVLSRAGAAAQHS